MNQHLFINGDMQWLLQWDRGGYREAKDILDQYPCPVNVIMAAVTIAACTAMLGRLIKDRSFCSAWYPLLIPAPPVPEPEGEIITVNHRAH